MKLTFKHVQQELAKRNVTILRKDGEYKVRCKGSPAGHGYFTNDLQDAWQTGLAMESDRLIRAVESHQLQNRPPVGH